jgi:regulatory protein
MAFKRPVKKEPLEAAALYEYALGALSRRMRTVAELKRLMKSRVEIGEAGEAKIEAVVVHLKEQKYLDDTAFAADYTRLRQENEKFGKRRVQQELAQKGVEKELVSTTITDAYENVDEEELARRFLARKRKQQPTTPKETTRVMNLLLRAGFSSKTIYKILRNWNVDEEALAALEEIDNPDDSGNLID